MRAKVDEKESLMANESLREPTNFAELPEQSIRSTSCRSNQTRRFSITNIKLNFKLPKVNMRDSSRICLFEALKSVALLTLLMSLVHVDSHPFSEPISSNEISQQHLTNFSQLSRDVTNLQMIPDLRSIRLRWNYVQPNSSHILPAAFEIRFCELTSWMAEIKCRHRNLPVAAGRSGEESTGLDTQETTTPATNSNHSTVIHYKQLDTNVARFLTSEPLAESSSPTKSAIGMISSSFETHIYDLRALTNYTFDVHVSRFTGEPPHNQINSGPLPVRVQPRPARRMDLTGGGDHNELLPSGIVAKSARPFRAETKPFQAEALKCLANSSEVLVNTGRYFGGRISVESQPFDSRCQLVGNKSSSQTSYLFRIDHEICHSKSIDSNRIETMILVHENKDILTHNTARFLVQCNIMQKSFTVKASVSLPKINSLNQQVQPTGQGRPATITLLPSRPNLGIGLLNKAPQEEQLVRLGSMPGVYRIIRAGGDNATQSVGLNQVDSVTAKLRDDEAKWATATTETNIGSNSRMPPVGEGQVAVSARRSKELLAHEKPQNQDKGLETGDNYQVELPRPVEVSSKILFVARANSDVPLQATRQRAARISPTSVSFVQGSGALSSSLQVTDQSRPLQLLDGDQNHKSPQTTADDERTRSMKAEARGQIEDDSNWALASMAQPIILTNNHRVANEFPSLAQVATTNYREQKTMMTTGVRETNPTTDYSIKYSPSKVAEYSLERVAFGGHNLAPGGNLPSATDSQPVQIRSRSGRMRQIGTTSQMIQPANDVGWDGARRTGDVLPQSDLIGAESAPTKGIVSILPLGDHLSNTTANKQISTMTNNTIASPTLAQNITGALIRWSLKTLGNLARKSLESLVDERDLVLTGDNQTRSLGGFALHGEERVRDGFLVESLSRSAKTRVAQPATSTTTSAIGLQQSIKAATQSADLVQSRAPHNLEPPPLVMAPSLKQATTVALVANTNSVHVTPSSVSATTKTPTTTQPHHSQHQQRQQKSNNQSINPIQSKTNSEQHQNQHAVRTSAQLDDRLANSLPANEGQTTPDNSSFRSLWPVYLLWALIGSAILSMLVIYFVAFSPSSTQIFKPSNSSRHYNHGQQPHSGFLSQLNDALHWHHHSTGLARDDRCATSVPNLYNSSKIIQPEQEQHHHQQQQQHQHQVNTISRLLPNSDVRSPSVQRRRPNDDARDRVADLSGTLCLTSSAASDFGSATTRSTSAASTANLSTRTGSSLEEHENYCKNHEQFVYSDYLLLNNSDCLANDCGRESFA